MSGLRLNPLTNLRLKTCTSYAYLYTKFMTNLRLEVLPDGSTARMIR